MDSIDKIRQEIDVLDNELVKLVEKRAQLVKSLIQHKTSEGLAVRQPEREKAIVTELYRRHGKSFTREELESIYSAIFDACVRIQLSH